MRSRLGDGIVRLSFHCYHLLGGGFWGGGFYGGFFFFLDGKRVAWLREVWDMDIELTLWLLTWARKPTPRVWIVWSIELQWRLIMARSRTAAGLGISVRV